MKHILVDIDGTITSLENNPYQDINGISCDYFRGILRDMLAKELNYDHSLALNMIQENASVFNGCNFRVAPSLGISERDLWEEVLAWQRTHLSVFDDAVDMVKALFAGGYNLYAVSNNSCKGIQAKLSRAGLADIAGSPYFEKFYGMDLFGLEWSKSMPEVYSIILQKERFSPEEVVMIGDEPAIDLESPLKGGMNYAIIVDRAQEEEVAFENGGVFVKSLKIVPSILRRLK
ncbi:MAG: HAD family hydrolase [bacterium]|nr:HAD family hydrolase [bacterium]